MLNEPAVSILYPAQGQCCSTCAAFENYQCRRNPPVPLMHPNGDVRTEFPRVTGADNCMQYIPADCYQRERAIEQLIREVCRRVGQSYEVTAVLAYGNREMADNLMSVRDQLTAIYTMIEQQLSPRSVTAALDDVLVDSIVRDVVYSEPQLTIYDTQATSDEDVGQSVSAEDEEETSGPEWGTATPTDGRDSLGSRRLEMS